MVLDLEWCVRRSVEFLGTMGIVFGGLFIAVNAGNLVPKDELPAFPLMAGRVQASNCIICSTFSASQTMH